MRSRGREGVASATVRLRGRRSRPRKRLSATASGPVRQSCSTVAYLDIGRPASPLRFRARARRPSARRGRPGPPVAAPPRRQSRRSDRQSRRATKLSSARSSRRRRSRLSASAWAYTWAAQRTSTVTLTTAASHQASVCSPLDPAVTVPSRRSCRRRFPRPAGRPEDQPLRSSIPHLDTILSELGCRRACSRSGC